jgi:hypothetical protein
MAVQERSTLAGSPAGFVVDGVIVMGVYIFYK